jgi:hypothetical protein
MLAAASLYMALEGRSHCSCFGRVEVNPWWTFGLDVVAIALLASFRPASSTDLPIAQSRLLKLATISVLLGGVPLAAFFVAVASPSDWLAQLRGQTVTAEPAIADLGTGWPGEVRTFTVLLTNRSTSPVRIVGGTARCGCTVTRDLPLELAPGETEAMQVEVRFLGSPGRFTEPYQLYTDAAGEWVVVARFSGRVMQLPSKED